MKRTLLFAAASAALVAAPAWAQMYPNSDAGKSWDVPHRSSGSGLPTDSPQVDSLGTGTQGYSGSSTPSGSMGMDSDPTTGTQTQSGMTHDRTMKHKQTQSMDGGSGSTGYASSPSGSGMVSHKDITSRRGRGQRDLELTQTTLLNEFSAQGYTAVRDFHKKGQNYVANVQDAQGRWMTVELDAQSRTITPTH